MSLPYFPMFPADFDADTGHLSFAEDGAYNRLLRLSWRCPGAKMPDDMDWIHRKSRAVTAEDRALVASVIAEFFTRAGGKIYNQRLVCECQKSSLAHAKRVSAGSAGGRAKALNGKINGASNATAMLYQPEPEPEVERKSPSGSTGERTSKLLRFDEFWAIYPHRDGSKRKRKDAVVRYAAAVRRGVSEQTIIDGANRARGDPQVLRGYARDPAAGFFRPDGKTKSKHSHQRQRKDRTMDGQTHGSPQLPTREWLTGRVMVLLSHFYTQETDPAVVMAQAADWFDTLWDVPQVAVEQACRDYLRSGPRRRPSPGDIRNMAVKHLPKPSRKNADDLMLDGPPRERADPSAAAAIMAAAGFTPKRMTAIARAPMALSFAEAETVAERPRVPHWTETASASQLARLEAIRWADPAIRECRIAAGMVPPS